MRLRMILFLTCSWLGLGCVTKLDYLNYDNPRVRRLRDIESRKHLPDTETWLQLTNYVGSRVGIIGPAAEDIGAGESFSELLGGRGAGLTSDGYFVTAFHIAKGDSFYLHETRYNEILTKPGVRFFRAGELDGLITQRRSQGRLVWHDDELDLALVKFNIGAPIVSERGEVLGVLTEAHGSRSTGRIQTQATKVDADLVRELIAADRTKIRN